MYTLRPFWSSARLILENKIRKLRFLSRRQGHFSLPNAFTKPFPWCADSARTMLSQLHSCTPSTPGNLPCSVKFELIINRSHSGAPGMRTCHATRCEIAVLMQCWATWQCNIAFVQRTRTRSHCQYRMICGFSILRQRHHLLFPCWQR